MDVKTVIKVRWSIKGGPESNRTSVSKHRHTQKEGGVRTWGEDGYTSRTLQRNIITGDMDKVAVGVLSYKLAHMSTSGRLSHHLSPELEAKETQWYSLSKLSDLKTWNPSIQGIEKMEFCLQGAGKWISPSTISIQALNRLHDGHPPCEGESSSLNLPIQLIVFSRNTLADILRNHVLLVMWASLD